MAHLSRRIAVIAAGEMGAAVAARLVKAGHSVFTNLDGRSQRTRQRASDAGMQDVPFTQMAQETEWMLSILPPRDAVDLAQKYVDALKGSGKQRSGRKVYVDCNAVSPVTVKKIASLFEGSGVTFLDAGIIGGPPSDTYSSHIYASADPSDEDAQTALKEFIEFEKCGIKMTALQGDGADIGSASALKMSYAGITKGTTGLFCTMILAAHASSPSTSSALLHEMAYSQPQLLQRIARGVPTSIPKAYRWVAEMEEISSFVDSGLRKDVDSEGVSSDGPRDSEASGEGQIHQGMANIFRRLETALEKDGKDEGDIGTLLAFAKEAGEVLAEKAKS
ncbi:6-phosphogluconate dehydrogenase C-terminal domain-like protein [Schizopora paradoxa]|uniref:6-phosphogluconate dehydrogenase C-terminal domain-like protein n=1 Tax=Schizopora paradoxa TaxID=27342 RepID=A0A0H2RVC6_9AGAM|nr:6-phosphogluconate dehydrogenase C-terminal domain-like protein [Schizopora paradoxa]